MLNWRKNIRYQTLAGVRIEGIAEGETHLKNLSITGCCVECTSYADIKLAVQYKMEIIPEKIAKIGKFYIIAEPKWIHTGAYSCEIGFSIVESPKGKQFQHYVDYLGWRYAQGNSMIESGSEGSV